MTKSILYWDHTKPEGIYRLFKNSIYSGISISEDVLSDIYDSQEYLKEVMLDSSTNLTNEEVDRAVQILKGMKDQMIKAWYEQ